MVDHSVRGDAPSPASTYTTDGIAPEDRLPHFDDLQVHSDHPMHVHSAAPTRFGAHARMLNLGAVDLVDLSCTPAVVDRTARLVQQGDPDLISVVFSRSGHILVTQDGREALLRTGDLAFYTSSRPFRIRIDNESPDVDGRARLVRAHMPRSMLSAVAGDFDEMLATPLPGRRGVGALLGQFLVGVTDDAAELVPSDLPRLGNIAVDLVTATLSHETDARVGASTGQPTMLWRITTFVRQRLHDPHLSPASIAAAHHISVSYLHRLFQEHETTLWAWIRQERMNRARRDLADPRLRHLPVHRIGARWGYLDHATFTRAFRASFGVPPRDFRNDAIRGGLSST